jgi:hypothetical protein
VEKCKRTILGADVERATTNSRRGLSKWSKSPWASRGNSPLPWITPHGDLDYFRSVVKDIIRAAGLRDELSFTSFRHGGFTEGADADMTDAELRAAGRHRSARQLPTYAKRTRKQLISVAIKRRAERIKAPLSN